MGSNGRRTKRNQYGNKPGLEKMENTKNIIDTEKLIDLLRKKKEAVAFVEMLEDKKIVLTTTVINAFELLYGHKNPDKCRKTCKQPINS
jgi:hypothetical protein